MKSCICLTFDSERQRESLAMAKSSRKQYVRSIHFNVFFLLLSSFGLVWSEAHIFAKTKFNEMKSYRNELKMIVGCQAKH